MHWIPTNWCLLITACKLRIIIITWTPAISTPFTANLSSNSSIFLQSSKAGEAIQIVVSSLRWEHIIMLYHHLPILGHSRQRFMYDALRYNFNWPHTAVEVVCIKSECSNRQWNFPKDCHEQEINLSLVAEPLPLSPWKYSGLFQKSRWPSNHRGNHENMSKPILSNSYVKKDFRARNEYFLNSLALHLQHTGLFLQTTECTSRLDSFPEFVRYLEPSP